MWYQAYQWEDNPFSIKPNVNLVGLEKEKSLLEEYLISGNICLLTGEPGTGKTSLLKLLRQDLGKAKVVYINAEETDEFFDLHKHLRGQRTFLEKLFLRQPRNVILLLDEGHASDDRLKNHIKTLHDAGVLKGVVMAQTKPPFEYSDSIQHRIGTRIVYMQKLTDERVAEIIDRRTNAKHPFDKGAMIAIAKHAGYNPRKLLEFCEVVAMHLSPRVTSGEVTMIGEEHVRSVLEQVSGNFFAEEPYRLTQPTLEPGLLNIEGVDELSFSPMQKRVVKILGEGHRTAGQLAKILNTTEGSVGKQISLLMDRRVVKVENPRRPKVYGLAEEFRKDLASL